MRIISLSPSITEILFAIGQGSQIIARTEYCNYPENGIRTIPIILSMIKPNLKKIIELKPDLVLTANPAQLKLAKALRESDLPVAHVEPHTLSEVIKSIEMIGDLTDSMEQAKTITSNLLLHFAELRLESESFIQSHYPSKRPRIYIEDWSNPPFVCGNWIPELVEIAGGTYGLVKPGEPSREVPDRKIIEYDPEMIILSICNLGLKAKVSSILSRKSWQSISAIKSKQVYIFDDSILVRPGPRLMVGCRKIHDLIRDSFLK